MLFSKNKKSFLSKSTVELPAAYLAARSAIEDGDLSKLDASLKETGLDINAKDEYGLTLLHDAVIHNFEPGVIRLLQEDKLDCTVSNNLKVTVLPLCAFTGQYRLTEIILKKAKAQNKLQELVDMRDKAGVTALSAACYSSSINNIRLLLEAKADLTIKSNENQSPLIVATLNPTFLEEIDPKSDIYHRVIQAIQLLVDACVDDQQRYTLINTIDIQGATALHYAAANNKLILVKFLIEKCNADITVAVSNNNTPLNLAIIRGHFTVAQYLVEHLKNNRKVSFAQKTAIFCQSTPGYPSIIDFMCCDENYAVKEKDYLNILLLLWPYIKDRIYNLKDIAIHFGAPKGPHSFSKKEIMQHKAKMLVRVKKIIKHCEENGELIPDEKQSIPNVDISSSTEWTDDVSAQNIQSVTKAHKKKAKRKKTEDTPLLAETTDVNTQYKLAWQYDCGDGVTQNTHQAVYWYVKAAEQKHGPSLNNLGRCYELAGQTDQALASYTAAWKEGDTAAAFNLGAVCFEQEKYQEALDYWNPSAHLGNPFSAFWLGYCYWYGKGVEPDQEYARQLNPHVYERLTVYAQAGHPEAKIYLATYFTPSEESIELSPITEDVSEEISPNTSHMDTRSDQLPSVKLIQMWQKPQHQSDLSKDSLPTTGNVASVTSVPKQFL